MSETSRRLTEAELHWSEAFPRDSAVARLLDAYKSLLEENEGLRVRLENMRIVWQGSRQEYTELHDEVCDLLRAIHGFGFQFTVAVQGQINKYRVRPRVGELDDFTPTPRP